MRPARSSGGGVEPGTSFAGSDGSGRGSLGGQGASGRWEGEEEGGGGSGRGLGLALRLTSTSSLLIHFPRAPCPPNFPLLIHFPLVPQTSPCTSTTSLSVGGGRGWKATVPSALSS